MGDVVELVDGANCRRLTRPREAHYHENFALLDRKRHVAEPNDVS